MVGIGSMMYIFVNMCIVRLSSDNNNSYLLNGANILCKHKLNFIAYTEKVQVL